MGASARVMQRLAEASLAKIQFTGFIQVSEVSVVRHRLSNHSRRGLHSAGEESPRR